MNEPTEDPDFKNFIDATVKLAKAMIVTYLIVYASAVLLFLAAVGAMILGIVKLFGG